MLMIQKKLLVIIASLIFFCCVLYFSFPFIQLSMIDHEFAVAKEVYTWGGWKTDFGFYGVFIPDPFDKLYELFANSKVSLNSLLDRFFTSNNDVSAQDYYREGFKITILNAITARKLSDSEIKELDARITPILVDKSMPLVVRTAAVITLQKSFAPSKYYSQNLQSNINAVFFESRDLDVAISLESLPYNVYNYDLFKETILSALVNFNETYDKNNYLGDNLVSYMKFENDSREVKAIWDLCTHEYYHDDTCSYILNNRPDLKPQIVKVQKKMYDDKMYRLYNITPDSYIN